MTAITDKHCLWCGQMLDDPEFPRQLYCSSGHSTKQREHRRKISTRRQVACPTPNKDGFPHRGTAFRAAAISNQFAYLCGCGVYHLTPTPHRRTRRAVGRRTISRRAHELGAEQAPGDMQRIRAHGDELGVIQPGSKVAA